MWRYRNPVEIGFGAGRFARLPELIAGERGKNYIGDPERFQDGS